MSDKLPQVSKLRFEENEMVDCTLDSIYSVNSAHAIFILLIIQDWRKCTYWHVLG